LHIQVSSLHGILYSRLKAIILNILDNEPIIENARAAFTLEGKEKSCSVHNATHHLMMTRFSAATVADK
jgi:hypothetical protein